MQFVESRPGDMEGLIAKSKAVYDKLGGPGEVEFSISGLDPGGIPRIVMTAAKVAVVWMTIDHTWETPAMRWNMIEQTYREIRRRLREEGYVAAYCFFADGVPNGYIRRLVALGADRVIDRCVRFASQEES